MFSFRLFYRPALLMAFMVLSACGDDTTLSPAEPSWAPQAFPSSLDRDDTLAGQDHNLNGVRDDVEQWIHSHDALSTPAQHALMQYALVMQQTVQASAQQALRARELVRQQASAYACLASLPELKPHAVAWGKRLRQITANTEARIRAHLAYSAALDGQSWTLAPEEDCHAS